MIPSVEDPTTHTVARQACISVPISPLVSLSWPEASQKPSFPESPHQKHARFVWVALKTPSHPSPTAAPGWPREVQPREPTRAGPLDRLASCWTCRTTLVLVTSPIETWRYKLASTTSHSNCTQLAHWMVVTSYGYLQNSLQVELVHIGN